MKNGNSISFLFLGGAKRVSMAQLFTQACKSRGFGCKIYGYELDTHVPLSIVADKIIKGLRWSDPEIFKHLDSVCAENDIDIIVPFVDGAVGIAADYTQRHNNKIFSPVCSRDLAETMFDKTLSAKLFHQHSLPVPATFSEAEYSIPLIAKPRHGSASKGIIEIDNQYQLDKVLANSGKYLIQERIVHKEEITVDCYVGVNDGEIYAISPRIRREVSGGEVVSTQTISNQTLAELCRHTIMCTGLRGAVTIQFLYDKDSDRYLLMEINPRLGGGAVASVHAGADIPGLVIDEFKGHPLHYQNAEDGIRTDRYLADVVYKID